MRRYDGIFLLNFLSNKEKGEFAAAMMLLQGGEMFWMSFWDRRYADGNNDKTGDD